MLKNCLATGLNVTKLILALALVSSVQIARAEHGGASTAAILGQAVLGAQPFTKAVTKEARKSDLASEYILEADGDLFRMVKGKKCQVTTSVKEIKVSQHPSDVAVLYYSRMEGRDENLYVLHNAERTGDCPKTSRKMIMENVKKFTVTSNTNTTIVNSALSDSGRFVAWENNQAVLSQNNIQDYSMNQNFGVAGAPFSSYALFTLNNFGYITKVKGNDVQNSKADESRRYQKIQDFKEANNIK